eukprot:10508990-Alexandrium_andersonii.AAC.1
MSLSRVRSTAGGAAFCGSCLSLCNASVHAPRGPSSSYTSATSAHIMSSASLVPGNIHQHDQTQSSTRQWFTCGYGTCN